MKEELQKLEKKLKRLYNRNFPNPVNWSEVEETRREIEETRREIEETEEETIEDLINTFFFYYFFNTTW